MSSDRQDGLLFFVGSAAVVGVLHLSAVLFPDRWGGPNILLGLLIAGGYFGMVTGAVLLLASARRRHRHRSRKSRR